MDCCIGSCCVAGIAAWFRCHLKATGVWRDRPRGPLKGVKVVDLSQALAGPYASKLLADMGAEVVRVDVANHPDPLQLLGSSPGQGMSGAFVSANAGKRSLAVDLQRGGLDVFRKLVKGADVVLHSFEPGFADDLGLGYEAVKALSPNVIYMSISGFGSTGPRANDYPYGPLVQCLAGLCVEQADESGPRLVPSALAEKLASLTVTQAIVAALVARDRGVGGQHLEVSILESLVQFLWPDNYCTQLWQVPCPEGAPPPHLFHRLWSTKDAGESGEGGSGAARLAMGAASDREWLALCRAIQRPELAKDERFASAADRAEHLADWVSEVQAALSSMSRSAAAEALEREGVPFALASSQEDVFSDIQSRDTELFIRMRHAFLGSFRQPQFPCEFGENAACGPARSPAPMPGEHSAKILAEVGFSRAEAAELLATGAVLDGAAYAEQTGMADRKHSKLARFFASMQKLDKENLWHAEGPPLSKVDKSQTQEAVELMRGEGPFAGLQVLEVGVGLDISLAGGLIADQGADVTKVEFTDRLDPARFEGPAPAEGMAATHMAANRGKRSLVVNRGNPKAYEVMEQLVKNMDAIIISLPVEQAAELGLSYWDLQHKRKGLVYVSLAGFNSRGPRFWEPGHDCLLQALSGGAAACRDGRGEPTLVSTNLADKVTAMFAAISLGAACRMQLRGVVQQVEIDKYSCMVNFNFPDLFQDAVWENLPPSRSSSPPLGALWRLVDTSDRKAALCVVAVGDEEFRGLCEALGHQEWLEVEAWKTLPGRLKDVEALSAALDTAVKAMDTASLTAACKQNCVPCAPVLGIQECMQDPQVLRPELFEVVEHPVLGRYRLPRHAAQFSATPARGRTPAPAPGEGMVDLMEACGYSRERLSDLVSAGAVAAPRQPQPTTDGWASVLLNRLSLQASTWEESWKQAGFKASALRGLRPREPSNLQAQPASSPEERLAAEPSGVVTFAL